MLPQMMDVNFMRLAMIVVIVIAFFGVLYSAYSVEKPQLRVLLIMLLVGLSFGAWQYRESLENCRYSCSCSFAGKGVPCEVGAPALAPTAPAAPDIVPNN